jgi:hypothetical protein
MDISKVKKKIVKILGAIVLGAAIGFGFAKPKEEKVKVKIQGEEEK